MESQETQVTLEYLSFSLKLAVLFSDTTPLNVYHQQYCKQIVLTIKRETVLYSYSREWGNIDVFTFDSSLIYYFYNTYLPLITSSMFQMSEDSFVVTFCEETMKLALWFHRCSVGHAV